MYGSAKNPGAPDAEDEGGHRDERIGGVDVAADQEPRDGRSEPPSGETPLLDVAEVGAAPARGDEAEHGDECETCDEDGDGDRLIAHRVAR